MSSSMSRFPFSADRLPSNFLSSGLLTKESRSIRFTLLIDIMAGLELLKFATYRFRVLGQAHRLCPFSTLVLYTINHCLVVGWPCFFLHLLFTHFSVCTVQLF